LVFRSSIKKVKKKTSSQNDLKKKVQGGYPDPATGDGGE